MATRDTPWPSGTPCWVDLVADDTAAAAEFYSRLFGWTVDAGSPEFGGYTIALLDGRPVAGIGPKPPEADMPCTWQTYLATNDVEATLEAVTTHGGQVMMPVMDVGSFGRMTVGTDPTGGAFALWQAREHNGFGVFDRPNTVCWSEFHTREFVTARDFYGSVFDWQWTSVGDSDEFRYAMFRVGDQDAGGLFHDTMMPDTVPSHWLVWVAVDDVDAVTAHAVTMGATRVMGPHDSPFGRMTCIQGPQGEVLGLIDPSRTATTQPESTRPE